MSHQFAPTFSKTEGEDDLARFDGMESLDGYNVIGGRLLVALETKNANELLNDIGRVEGKTPSLSVLGSVVAQYKNFDGTFDTDIKAPATRATNPLDIGGMRVVENGGFVYDTPTVLSSDWDVGEQPKMIDRIFTSNPAVLTVDNNESKNTVFDFSTIAIRNLTVKISADIISGTPNLTYDILVSDDNLTFASIDSASLTDGVEKLIQSSQTFRFVKVVMTAEDENTFSVDFNIFDCFELNPSTITSSDWSTTTNMIDTDLNTFDNLLSNIGVQSSQTISDFGSIATRNIVVILGSLTNSGTATHSYEIAISDTNSGYSIIDSGIATSTTQLILPSISLRFLRIIIKSTGTSFDADHRIYLIGETISFTSVGFSDFIDDANSIDNDFSTFAFAENDFSPITTVQRASSLTGSIGCRIKVSSNSINPKIEFEPSTFYTQFLGLNVLTDVITTSTTAQNITLDITTGNNSADTELYEVYYFNPPTITSSDWSTTTNMIDNKSETFNTNNVIETPPNTVFDFGSIDTRLFNTRLESTIVAGSPSFSYEIEISDDNITFVSIDSASLTSGVITDITIGVNSFRYVKISMSLIGVEGDSANLSIYESYSPISPIIFSSDWSTTTNMIDADLNTFDSLNVSNPDTTRETIIDFGSIEPRDVHALIQPNTISGAPTYSYILTGSTDNITYFPIDSGVLTDGNTTDANGGSQTLRYAKIEMIGEDIGIFEADFDIFEVYDGDIINGLDFSTVKISGAGQVSTPNKPWIVEVSDGGEVLQPNQMFGILENTDLTMEVVTLRTGQRITLDRITSRVINRA